jgi:hypothetical protein
MAKFRKIPVVIDAVQLTWPNWSEICEFVPKPWFVRGCYLDAEGKETKAGDLEAYGNSRIGLILQTLESQEFLAQENDWIIKGVNGEFYPCKPDIFAKTYEEEQKPDYDRAFD